MPWGGVARSSKGCLDAGMCTFFASRTLFTRPPCPLRTQALEAELEEARGAAAARVSGETDAETQLREAEQELIKVGLWVAGGSAFLWL